MLLYAACAACTFTLKKNSHIQALNGCEVLTLHSQIFPRPLHNLWPVSWQVGVGGLQGTSSLHYKTV